MEPFNGYTKASIHSRGGGSVMPEVDAFHRRHHRLSPPLIIEKSKIDALLGILAEAIAKIE